MKSHEEYLRIAIDVSKRSRENGNTPFGAILVDKDGDILMEQENIEITERCGIGHAEIILASRASKEYTKDFLWDCTLYTTVEPCCMCSGAIYWCNIGTVVYGMSELDLLKITGDDPQNPTFHLPCRDVFSKGQKDIKVLGPFPSVEEGVREVHEGFWGKKVLFKSN